MPDNSSKSELDKSSGRTTRGISKCCFASNMALRQLSKLKVEKKGNWSKARNEIVKC